MDKGRVIYLAHPVGVGNVETNLRRARLWFRWAVHQYPGDTISLPWLAYCETMDPVADRERSLAANIRALRQPDAIMLCGGEISDGMRGELEAMEALGREVINHTNLGPLPPAHMSATPRRAEMWPDEFWANVSQARDRQIADEVRTALSLVMTDLNARGVPFAEVFRQVAETCYRFAAAEIFDDAQGDADDRPAPGIVRRPIGSRR